jgi:UDP-N-acetylmuramoyl-L-alanyl-D-glutamate--2,6-diaminopimelate ligase
VELAGGPLVLVDYAHTPDGMSQALKAARRLTGGHEALAGRLLVVFGCGGDRDRGKRPLMAQIAATAADLAILTLDNPRTEDPRRIFEDAERGFVAAGARERARTVEDRAGAIEAALQAARPEDVVLIAGKGHETYQIIGTEKLPWDDRDAARDAWARLHPKARRRSGTGAP